MIREISANSSVLNLSTRLTNAGLVISPLPNSPLAELYTASYPDGLHGEAVYYQDGLPKVRETSITPTDVIEASTIKEIDGNSTHDLLIENYSRLAAKAIQDNLLLARTVVNPLIKEVLKEVHVAIDETIETNLNRIGINAVKTPEVLLSPALADLVGRYDDTAYEEVEIKHIFPDMDAEGIIETAMTGSKSFDILLRSYLEGIDRTKILEIYRGVFSVNINTDGEDRDGKLAKTFVSNKSPANLSYFVTYPDTYMGTTKEASLLCFLLAKKFLNDVPGGVNLDLSEYKAYVSLLMEQAGRVMAIYLRKQADQFKRQALVLNYPNRNPEAIYASDNATINVDGHLYNEWLRQGGAPEIILGAFVLGDLKEIDSGNVLLEGADKYKEAWNRFYGLLKTEQMSQIFNTTVAAVRDVVSSMIANADENLGLNKAEAQCHLMRIIEGLSFYDTQNVHALVRDIICDVMFPCRNVKRILMLVDHYAETNPHMPILEAAYWATTDLVVDWVGTMIQTEKSDNV